MTPLLLYSIFGLLITVIASEKCCQFYVSPPSTVFVQLKNSVIGTVPRHSSVPQYSSQLLSQNQGTNNNNNNNNNNYLLANYHANGNPNYIYQTTPPQSNLQQNAAYGINSPPRYIPPNYYSMPGYLPTAEIPRASPANPSSKPLANDETNKKPASYYVSSAFFAPNSETNENSNSMQSTSLQQHQLGDSERNKNPTIEPLHENDDERSEEQPAETAVTAQSPPFISLVTTYPHQTLPPNVLSAFYSSGLMNHGTNVGQSIKNKEDGQFSINTKIPIIPTEMTTQITQSPIQFKTSKPITVFEETRTATSMSQPSTHGKSITMINENGVTTAGSSTSSNRAQNNIQKLLTSIPPIDNNGFMESSQTAQFPLVNYPQTLFTKKITASPSINIQTTKQQNQEIKSSTSIAPSNPTFNSESQPTTSTQSTTTIFTVMPYFRDAQRYGNNQDPDNSAASYKYKQISVIILLSFAIHFITFLR